MGNKLSQVWWGWYNDAEETEGYENKMKAMEEKMKAMEMENELIKQTQAVETNAKKEQTEADKNKKEEDINNIIKVGLDPDMWDLLQFIEGQGKDTSNIKKQIADVLTNHQMMNYHLLTGALETNLSIHEPFNDMANAISTALKTGLLSLPQKVIYDRGLEKSVFTLEVSKLAAAVGAGVTAVASAGAILAAVLGELKDIDFFSKSVETHTCGNQSLSIIEVMSNDNTSAIALFEIARVSVSLRNVKGHVVCVGSEASTARVGVYYARGTVSLKDLFPKEEERCQVITKLQTAAEQRRLFKRQQYMKRNIEG